MIRQKLLHILNIRPHEAVLVQRLFIVQFFLVVGVSFLFVIANAVFLSRYRIIELPKAFFITGLFLLLFNWLYSKVEHALRLRRLLFTVIFFSIALTLIMRIGLLFPAIAWMPYVLLVGYNIVYLITALIFWGMAAMLFNVRESKRLFTIIGAGDVPAKLIGYLLVSFLAPYIGLANMIWIAAAAFVIALPLAWQMFNIPQVAALERQRHENGPVRPSQNKLQQKKKVFGSDLILTISILSLITFAALILIDFTFMAEVKVKYHTDIELAYFLGIFFALGRILAVILKFTLSSRMIARLGLVWSLLLSPITLFILIVIILFLSNTGQSQHLLYLFGIMALLTEILKSIIQEPVFLVLFQPLKPSLRLKGHVIAKGYMLALAMVVIGGGLVWYLSRAISLSAGLFSYALAIMLILWIGSILMVKKEYLKTLYEAIKSGFFRGNELYLQEKNVIELLLQKTTSQKPAEVLSAVDLLERSGYDKMDLLLIELLKKKDQTILKYALKKIIDRKQADALPVIRELLDEGNSEVTALCIEAWSILDPDSHKIIERYLHSGDKNCRHAAMIGMLKNDDLESFILAGQQLLKLVKSPLAEDRISGTEVIHEVGEYRFYKLLCPLLHDTNIKVQKKAILAAGKIPNNKLLKLLTEKLNNPATSKEATSSLIKHGDQALSYFETALESNPKLLPHFIAIAGGISSEKANNFLVRHLLNGRQWRAKILDQLWALKFIIRPGEKKPLKDLIADELYQAGDILHYIHRLPVEKETVNMRKALDLEVNIHMNNVLKALSFMYNRPKINDVMNTLASNHDHKISNALEMLEMTIPRAIFRKFNAIIEERFHQHKKVRSHKEDITAILTDIISQKNGCYNLWTRASAISYGGSLRNSAMIHFLNSLPLDDEPPIIKETGDYVTSHQQEV